ncbi:uncharacterized protein LOC113305739 [Papaver somniferum]|uniref:uncharacterized protein LOC113305739 n=1 Tax=Papaver somniferum TaxID=3469 RepID=UPI000E6F634E|nr:uncharacterized protein LOC113305739 [Papaver somniferum]
MAANNSRSSFDTSAHKSDDSNKVYSTPVLFISDEDIDESLNEWKFSLIGILDFVKLKFETAVTSLKNQWKLTGAVQLIPIGKGFFIIKLDNEIDMNYIWKGYWMVDSQTLKLREWEPNFNPVNQKSTTAFVWRKVGYYASVLVEIDLAQHIPNHILINTKHGSFELEIQIPRIPKFCDHCKVVGHLVVEYRSKKKDIHEEDQVDVDGFTPVIKRNVWRVKAKKATSVVFDICPSPKRIVADNTVNSDIFSYINLVQSPKISQAQTEVPTTSNEIGEHSGVIKEIIQPGELHSDSAVIISVNKFNPIAEVGDSMDYSSSEDGEIKEVNTAILLNMSSVSQPVTILKPSVEQIVLNKHTIIEKKKPPAKIIKTAPTTRKTRRDLLKTVLNERSSTPPHPSS